MLAFIQITTTTTTTTTTPTPMLRINGNLKTLKR